MRRILVVDDDPQERGDLVKIVRALGYEAEVAGDGEEALEKLGANPVDAIVTDLMMPRMDGYTLLKTLLGRGDLTPEGYTAPTPDSRPTTRDFAGERIARVVCADRELLDDSDIDRIAAYVADTMIARIAASITRVRDRHPQLVTGVIAGHGAFLARAVKRHVEG